MKKIFLFVLLLVIVGGIAAGWYFLGPGTGFSKPAATLYISSRAADKNAVLDSLKKNKIVLHPALFNWLAGKMNYWTQIKPGKYEIDKGASLLSIIRKIRNGQQTPVNLVITKLRTKEDFAKLTGKKFEFDSTQMLAFLQNSDSLETYGVDTATALTVIIPDTYTFFWTATPHAIFDKLYKASGKFWTEAKRQKATAMGLTTQQAYILASIVEEETTNHQEQDTVASVYLNRMKIGMPLQADPTVKFAMRDFGLKRIYQKHLAFESPYNTYKVKGLPPGPICTPSKKTIEAVLNAPSTNYLYFVANPDFSQSHSFSATYPEHQKKAALYQQALNERQAAKQNSER